MTSFTVEGVYSWTRSDGEACFLLDVKTFKSLLLQCLGTLSKWPNNIWLDRLCFLTRAVKETESAIQGVCIAATGIREYSSEEMELETGTTSEYESDLAISNCEELILFALMREARLVAERATLPARFRVLDPERLSTLYDSFSGWTDGQRRQDINRSDVVREIAGVISSMDGVILQPWKWPKDVDTHLHPWYLEGNGSWETVW